MVASPATPPPTSARLHLQQSPPPSHSSPIPYPSPVITRSASTHTRSYSMSSHQSLQSSQHYTPPFRPLHAPGTPPSLHSNASFHPPLHSYSPPHHQPVPHFYSPALPFPAHLLTASQLPPHHPAQSYPHSTHAHANGHRAGALPSPHHPQQHFAYPPFHAIEGASPNPMLRTLLPRQSPPGPTPSSLLHPHPRRSASLMALSQLDDPAALKSPPVPPFASGCESCGGLQSPSAEELAAVLECPLAALLGLTESVFSRSHVPKALSRATILSPAQSPQPPAHPSPAPSTASVAVSPLPSPSDVAAGPPPPSPLCIAVAADAVPPSPSASSLSSSYAAVVASLPRKLSATSLPSPSSASSPPLPPPAQSKPRGPKRAQSSAFTAANTSAAATRRAPSLLSSAPSSPVSVSGAVPPATTQATALRPMVRGASFGPGSRRRARRQKPDAGRQEPERGQCEEKQQPRLLDCAPALPPLTDSAPAVSAVASLAVAVVAAAAFEEEEKDDADDEVTKAIPAGEVAAVQPPLLPSVAEPAPVAVAVATMEPEVAEAVKSTAAAAVPCAAPESAPAAAAAFVAAPAAAVVSQCVERVSAASPSSSRSLRRARRSSSRAQRTVSEDSSADVAVSRGNDAAAPSSSSASPSLLSTLASVPSSARHTLDVWCVRVCRLSFQRWSAIRSAFRRPPPVHQKAPQGFVHRLKELSSAAQPASQQAEGTRRPHLLRSKHQLLQDKGSCDGERRMQRWMVRCMLFMALLLIVVVVTVMCMRMSAV